MNSMHNDPSAEPTDELERRLAQLSLVQPSAGYGDLARHLSQAGQPRQRFGWSLAAGLIAAIAVVGTLSLQIIPALRGDSSIGEIPPLVSSTAGDDTSSPTYIAGTHYTEINSAVSSGTQTFTDIKLFFSYPCFPCYEFEGELDNWRANRESALQLSYVPVTWSEETRYYAQVFYAAEVLGVQDRAHGLLFDALHSEGQTLDDQGVLARFFEGLGIPRQRLQSVYNSEEVLNLVEAAERENENFDIQSTPTLVVDCRYRISPNNEIGQREMIEVAQYFIDSQQAQEKQAC